MNHEGFAYLKYNILNPSLNIDNVCVKVSKDCYHSAVLYARVKNPDSIFEKNFAKSFRPLLPIRYKNVNISLIDFKSLININLTCCKIKPKYGKVYIKGKSYKLHNYIVEPLHIFKGRGDHPLRGTIKFPVKPEHITLNACKTPDGYNWGNIINNPNVQWAGFYKDSMGSSKYMYPVLNDETSKFDSARVLRKKLHCIRKKIHQDLESESYNTRQKATAVYLIDKLCIRVGHPKESDSADTVGCCTLRVEHVSLKKTSLSFSFLGKDSIEFARTLVPHTLVMQNMHNFTKDKSAHMLIFDSIDANSLNTYLHNLCKGLTAKQFRTCHASMKIEHLLHSYNPAIDGNIIKYFKQCATKVARLCNHKRGANLSIETSKANYIDPRIVYAFAKKHNIDVNSLYSQSLQERHIWARNTCADFRF